MIQFFFPEGRPKDESFGRPSGKRQALLTFIPGDKETVSKP